MAKLNSKATVKTNLSRHKDKTENYEGGLAFKMDAKTELYTRVASCLVGEPKFYKELNSDGSLKSKNQDDFIAPLISQVAKDDPEFVLQLASYVRNVMYLRTISMVMLVEASLLKECKPFVKQYTPQIVKRADELCETVAYLQKKIGHLGDKEKKGSMPSALKKGLAASFNNFDAFQLAKYNRKGSVKLKDVLRLVHPVPDTKEQSEVYKKILKDELESPETWEVVISSKGSTKENWESILPKMGYMALLRNLRNILEKGVSEHLLGAVMAKLSSRDEVKKSRQLPYRYFSAYKVVMGLSHPKSQKVMDTLSDAMDLSLSNLPKLSGTTLIVSDNSSSMCNPVSDKSTVFMVDIANLFLAMSNALCEESVNLVFGNEVARVNLSSRDSVLTNMQKARIEGEKVGGATDAWKTVQYLLDNKIFVDRILFFSDMQCYNSQDNGYSYRGDSLASMFKKYKSAINPNCYLYSIDLAGYGTAQLPQDESKVALLAGYSDRVLEFIKIFETDKAQAIELIKRGGQNGGLSHVSED